MVYQENVTKLSDIISEPYPILKWTVEDICPEGHTILSGRPKIGKTRLLHSIALDVAQGNDTLGVLHTTQCDVLMLALEDNGPRIKRRTSSMYDLRKNVPKNIDVATKWRRWDKGGKEDIEDWLQDHPHGLVCIDTFIKIAPHASGEKSLYRGDYELLAPVTELAGDTRSTIITVMHNRKMSSDNAWDELSGSTGLAGAADGLLMLRKTRNSDFLSLYVDGRDIIDPRDYALSYDKSTNLYKIEGQAWAVAMAQKQQEIFDLISNYPLGITIRDIAEKLGKNLHTTRVTIQKLKNENKIDLLSGNLYVTCGSTLAQQPTAYQVRAVTKEIRQLTLEDENTTPQEEVSSEEKTL
jgi:hypothetical protein